MRTLRRFPIRAFMAAAIAVAAIAAFSAALVSQPGQGLRLAFEKGQVVVASVDMGSEADRAGLRAGMVVVTMDGENVFSADDQTKRTMVDQRALQHNSILTVSRDQISCSGSESSTCVLPARYVPDPQYGDSTYGSGVFYLTAPSTCSLPSVGPSGSGTDTLRCAFSLEYTIPVSPSSSYEVVGIPALPPYGGPSDSWHFVNRVPPVPPQPAELGIAILAVGWLALRRGWAGSALKPFWLTLPLATAVPLIATSISWSTSEFAIPFVAVIVPLAMLPLAIDFLGRIEGVLRRRIVACVTMALAVAAVVVGIRLPGSWVIFVPSDYALFPWRTLYVAGIALVPGLLASRPSRSAEVPGEPGSGPLSIAARIIGRLPGPIGSKLGARRTSSSPTRSSISPKALLESFDVLVAALTPGIAAIGLTYTDDAGGATWPIAFWLVFVFFAMRLALRPLARLATRARHQRDLVVAATEAERARIAADIHDDALQDLTMLVRRLDAAGDAANAEAAREIAERLRAIVGDLRLPVLDDLGVGPALEWLCGRMDPSGREITLDRAADETRLPSGVELAVFRIAQEALSNAIRHGSTPIVVRYRMRQDWAELQIDDSGVGIIDLSAEEAELTGHLGLMNMTQRAEAIGGALQVGRRPTGGTRVSLVWDRAAGASAGTVGEPSPA